MRYHDLTYLAKLKQINNTGIVKPDRTGVGTKSLFGLQMVFDLSDGSIPLLTSKRMHIPSIIHEILWYLSGSTNIEYLQHHNITIWNEWADENGELGPGIYGNMWRNFPGPNNETIDQIANLVETLKTNPNDRRMVVTAWNPALVSRTNLPPCHVFWQCYVEEDRLSLMLTQRSCDWFLGIPFNMAQYSILLRMLAHVTGLKPGNFIHCTGDSHIYLNHQEQVNTLLARDPVYSSPYLDFSRPVYNIDDFRFDDFVISDYEFHPTIKAPVAV